jgi:hypothetical protein
MDADDARALANSKNENLFKELIKNILAEITSAAGEGKTWCNYPDSERDYDFFERVVGVLKKKGYDVETCDSDCCEIDCDCEEWCECEWWQDFHYEISWG